MTAKYRSQGKNALIILDGMAENALHWVEWDSYSLRLAVDGAYDRLRAQALLPDLLTGDFDSITRQGLRHAEANNVEIILNDDQDTTDSQKAISLMIERGIDNADMIGFRGTRIDHELATLSAVAAVTDKIHIRLIDEVAEGWILKGPATRKIQNAQGRTCSLMPLSTCKSVSLQGFQWPLEQVTLSPGERFACSNVVNDRSAEVKLLQGILLLYLHHGTSV
ncbi:MAG: thiamine diphosphokinase [bacterium]